MSAGSELASMLAAMRKIVDKRCHYCEGPMIGLKTKKYCCDSCKFKAFRARKKQQNDSTERI